ncbi:hypothetical protein [Halolamina pelagica]|uniref:hypothetical protein n=1 Tax=Halolamina pelagica TaxID=699431 RepID=UPI001EFB1226|nr:hypothetical protein [Halolamina pelagica]
MIRPISSASAPYSSTCASVRKISTRSMFVVERTVMCVRKMWNCSRISRRFLSAMIFG